MSRASSSARELGKARTLAEIGHRQRSEASKRGAATRSLAGPRVTKKMRVALDAMVRGLDRDAAAAEAKMHPRVLARNLNLPHIRALLSDRVQALIEGNAGRAAAAINTLGHGAASEYVKLAANQDVLNRAGIRRPEANRPPTGGIRIIFNVGSYPGDTPEKIALRRQQLAEFARPGGIVVEDAVEPASEPVAED